MASRAGNIEAFVGIEHIYGFIDNGVSRNRIPYERGSGRKTSKYIDGLIRFWMIKKGLGREEATRAAFALAAKHKKEGMPTQNSFRYAKNGYRLKFFTKTLDGSSHYDDFEDKVIDTLEDLADQVINNIQKRIK